MSQLPITSEQIKTRTHRDPMLNQVEQFTYHGWPESCPNEKLMLFGKKGMNYRFMMAVYCGVHGWLYQIRVGGKYFWKVIKVAPE